MRNIYIFQRQICILLSSKFQHLKSSGTKEGGWKYDFQRYQLQEPNLNVDEIVVLCVLQERTRYFLVLSQLRSFSHKTFPSTISNGVFGSVFHDGQVHVYQKWECFTETRPMHGHSTKLGLIGPKCKRVEMFKCLEWHAIQALSLDSNFLNQGCLEQRRTDLWREVC